MKKEERCWHAHLSDGVIVPHCIVVPQLDQKNLILQLFVIGLQSTAAAAVSARTRAVQRGTLTGRHTH